MLVLRQLASFEYSARRFCVVLDDEPSHGIQVRLVEQVSGHLSGFRGALPFSEAERVWMLSTVDCLENDPRKAQREFSDKQDELVIRGVRRVVHGRDLAHRWWSWRRRADEFTDQDSLDVAVEALGNISCLLVPELASNPQSARWG